MCLFFNKIVVIFVAEDKILYNTIFIFTVTDCHLKNGAYEL